MQPAIIGILELGVLPDSGASASDLQLFEKELLDIKVPISDEEACALVKLFGPDDCFGLAWTLLHLIESAPGWPIKEALDGMTGEWADRLRERSA